MRRSIIMPFSQATVFGSLGMSASIFQNWFLCMLNILSSAVIMMIIKLRQMNLHWPSVGKIICSRSSWPRYCHQKATIMGSWAYVGMSKLVSKVQLFFVCRRSLKDAIFWSWQREPMRFFLNMMMIRLFIKIWLGVPALAIWINLQPGLGRWWPRLQRRHE